MLEHQCSSQKGEEINSTTSPLPNSPTRTSNLIGNSLKYVSGAAIPQQPMFLASILSALQLVCYLYIMRLVQKFSFSIINEISDSCL